MNPCARCVILHAANCGDFACVPFSRVRRLGRRSFPQRENTSAAETRVILRTLSGCVCGVQIGINSLNEVCIAALSTGGSRKCSA